MLRIFATLACADRRWPFNFKEVVMSQANGGIFHIEGFDPSMIYGEGIGIESACRGRY